SAGLSQHLETPAIDSLFLVVLDFMSTVGIKDAQPMMLANNAMQYMNKYSENEQVCEYAMRVSLRAVSDESVRSRILEKGVWKKYLQVATSHSKNFTLQNYVFGIFDMLARNCSSSEKEVFLEEAVKCVVLETPNYPTLFSVIYECTKEERSEELMKTVVTEIRRFLEGNNSDVISLSNVLGILSNISVWGKFDIFEEEDFEEKVVKNVIAYTNDAIIMRFGLHLIRLASFKEKYSHVGSLAVVRAAMATFKESRIMQDGCVTCYNLLKSNKLSEQQRGMAMESVKVAKELFPEDKVVYAVWYALGNNAVINFVK
ncbi:hypothetical protein EIN_320180, partial [Entamoeba invadens IP1]